MMASSRSWFQSSFPEKTRRNSNHELPRWRAPSPMIASMIPPPIVQSVAALPSELPLESTSAETSSPFEERQHELESDLQILLDAQAEGLIRGLEGGGHGSRNSTGSTTPTFQSTRADFTNRFRKTTPKRPGLRSARKGIYRSIIALSDLKDEELEELGSQVEKSEQALGQIDAWEKKRHGLQEASHNVDTSEDNTRVQRLKQEASIVQADIAKVELHLMELKTKQRRILRQAADVENSIQAKLASYNSSLRMLEDDVQKFLSIEPEDDHIQPKSMDGKSSVWELPTKRRNLDMAKEFWNERRLDVLEQRKLMESEKTALVDGAELWKNAVIEVTEFEKQLRGEMSILSPASSNSNLAWEDPPGAENAGRMQSLLDKIGKVISSLESKHQHAEEQNWRLLIAALGAELDALRRGQQLLEGVVGVSVDKHAESNGLLQHDLLLSDAGQEIHELDKSFETARRPSLTRQISSTSDDPDPELLFSRQEHDFD